MLRFNCLVEKSNISNIFAGSKKKLTQSKVPATNQYIADQLQHPSLQGLLDHLPANQRPIAAVAIDQF